MAEIIYRHGDMFSSQMQTLTNPVNGEGVMGKGLALKFAQKWPAILPGYKQRCVADQMRPGNLYLCRFASHQWVLNFPTKVHWREPSQLVWIDMGMKEFSEHYQAWGITSIAFPRLGCGLGQLNWKDVDAIMGYYLRPLTDLIVEIYE